MSAEQKRAVWKTLLSACPVIVVVMNLAGCEGCNAPSHQQGARPRTSMAGQPEEYLDATRLDAKEDSSTSSIADTAFDANDGLLDTFEIVPDSAYWEEADEIDDTLTDSALTSPASSETESTGDPEVRPTAKSSVQSTARQTVTSTSSHSSSQKTTHRTVPANSRGPN